MKKHFGFSSFIAIFFLIISCDQDKEKNIVVDKNVKLDTAQLNIVDFLANYEFSSKTSADSDFKFPKIPVLNSSQTISLFAEYKKHPDDISKSISLLFLKYSFASSLCCHTEFPLVIGKLELDSLKNPLVYIWLKYSNNYSPVLLEGGFGGYYVELWIKKNNKWANDATIQKEIKSLDSLNDDIVKKLKKYSL